MFFGGKNRKYENIPFWMTIRRVEVSGSGKGAPFMWETDAYGF